ncbi:MAG: response regulator [Deltaproteobacteria bacterium]|nr:response regulator [Deltaproteobacteria bacterium]
MGRKILVVDDEKLVRWSIQKLIGREKCKVVCVASGLEAIEKIKEERFVLIITDLVMPDMNGIEVVKMARELQPGAKIIMMTAYSSAIEKNKAEAAGVSTFINKPFMINEVRSVISKFLSSCNT